MIETVIYASVNHNKSVHFREIAVVQWCAMKDWLERLHGVKLIVTQAISACIPKYRHTMTGLYPKYGYVKSAVVQC